MAFRLAMEASDEIAAVAAVAASLPTPDNSSCPQRKPTSRVMLINGTLDPINPYQGGNGHAFRLCEQRLRDVVRGIGAELCAPQWDYYAANSGRAAKGLFG